MAAPRSEDQETLRKMFTVIGLLTAMAIAMAIAVNVAV